MSLFSEMMFPRAANVNRTRTVEQAFCCFRAGHFVVVGCVTGVIETGQLKG